MMFVRPTYREWNRLPPHILDQLHEAVADYLKRSGEEITEGEVWQWIAHSVLYGDDAVSMLLLAVDGAEDDPKTWNLAGYALVRVTPGTLVTRMILVVWQIWVSRRYRFKDLMDAGFREILDWARKKGCTKAVWVTRRGAAYERWARRFGFEPKELLYEISIS